MAWESPPSEGPRRALLRGPSHVSSSGSVGIGDAVAVDPLRPRRGTAPSPSPSGNPGIGSVSFCSSPLVGPGTSRVFCSSLSRDVLRRASTWTAATIARPVFRASYARWRQLREQYRRGLVPSDSGTGLTMQCSHRRRPSSSRGMSYFVMTRPYGRAALFGSPRALCIYLPLIVCPSALVRRSVCRFLLPSASTFVLSSKGRICPPHIDR